MSKQTILMRIKKLEKAFAVEPEDDWMDVLMWVGSRGGVFGHVRYRFSKSGRKTEWTPCSDAEEIEIMRGHYEEDSQRLHGKGLRVSFAEYLERFCYLGPEELEARRRQIISQLKGGEDGARVEDSSC